MPAGHLACARTSVLRRVILVWANEGNTVTWLPCCRQIENFGLSGFLPDSLGELTSLTNIYLTGNNLKGTLPDSWKDLSNMQGVVSASSCHFPGTCGGKDTTYSCKYKRTYATPASELMLDHVSWLDMLRSVCRACCRGRHALQIDQKQQTWSGREWAVHVPEGGENRSWQQTAEIGG